MYYRDTPPPTFLDAVIFTVLIGGMIALMGWVCRSDWKHHLDRNPEEAVRIVQFGGDPSHIPSWSSPAWK